MADVGVPSGGSGSVVYRPIRALRVHAGAAHNLIGPGVQGGLTVAPLSSWVSPTLGVEAGRFFVRDANPAIARISGEESDVGALEHVAYDFASAHLGVELGRAWATFYVHGGVSWLRGDLGGSDTSEDGSVTTMTDVGVRGFGVSARLGFIVYFAK
jgi:hypothetical protein